MGYFTNVRDASNGLSRLLDRAADTSQVITRGGKPAGVLVNPAQWDAAEQALALEAEYLKVLAAAAGARVAHGESLAGAQVLAWLDAYIVDHGEPIDWETADLRQYVEDAVAPNPR